MGALKTFFADLAGPTAVVAEFGGKPKPGSSKPAWSKRLKDFSREKLEETLRDSVKRKAAALECNVKLLSEDIKKETPEEQFCKDMESGTAKILEHLKFIEKQIEHAEKYGRLSGLDDIANAAKALKTITGKLSSGLGKANKIASRAKEFAAWLSAASKLSGDTQAMDPRNRKTVEAWVKSLKQFADATKPFAQWAQSKAAAAAMAGAVGSQAAATLWVTLSAVGFQLAAGIALLDAGLAAVNKYIKRYDEIMKQIEREGPNPPPVPAPPAYPGDDWKSREELAKDAEAYENEQIQKASREKLAQANKEAKDDFDKNVLPGLYIGYRPNLRSQIKAAQPRSFGSGESPDKAALKWWSIVAKDKVTRAEALAEIAEFQQNPCPYFQKFYDAAYKRYLEKAKAA